VDKRFQWNELRSQLMSQYRRRCDALLVPAAKTSSAGSPGELASFLILELAKANKTRSPEELQTVQRSVVASATLAVDDVELMCMNGELLTHALKWRLPGNRATVAFDRRGSEVETSLRTGHDSKNASQTMLQNELDILRLYLGADPQ